MTVLRAWTPLCVTALALLPMAALPTAAVKGQETVCTPPSPTSFLSGPEPFGSSTGQGRNAVPETRAAGSASHYVSSDGHLCLRFVPSASPTAGVQAVLQTPSASGRAVLLSALAPGSGQRLLGQNRWTAYAAVEIWAWFRFLDRRRHGKRIQREYRDLAWLVARRVSTGQRNDAGWEYYETLSHFQASGAYDANPSQPGIQPEEDPDTFNGSIWALAQEIFFPEDPMAPIDENAPSYQKAFEYYLSRAYPPDLAWDWGTNSLHQEEYSDLIRESDENLRRSTTMIGVILANHLLSAIDALVSTRLREAGATPPDLDLFLAPQPHPRSGVVLSLRFRPQRFHEP